MNYLKIAQVQKQLWKYDVALQIDASLIPYETIGVVNFPGDVYQLSYLKIKRAIIKLIPTIIYYVNMLI